VQRFCCVSGCLGVSFAFVSQLLFANAMTLAIVNYLSEIITFLGKIFVAAASGFFCFWYVERTAKFQEGGSDAISSSWLPVIVRASKRPVGAFGVVACCYRLSLWPCRSLCCLRTVLPLVSSTCTMLRWIPCLCATWWYVAWFSCRSCTPTKGPSACVCVCGCVPSSGR
jgi:hypothetical protein